MGYGLKVCSGKAGYCNLGGGIVISGWLVTINCLSSVDFYWELKYSSGTCTFAIEHIAPHARCGAKGGFPRMRLAQGSIPALTGSLTSRLLVRQRGDFWLQIPVVFF